MGRITRTRAAGEWKAGSNEEGGATNDNIARIRASIHRRPRKGEPTQSERRGVEGMRPAIASGAGAWRQAAGRDHDRGRATAEVSSRRAITEDGEQRVDGAECADADSRRMGRDRARSVFHQDAADAERRSRLLRVRSIRTS